MGSPLRHLHQPRADVGADPDYRFSLANERTFLAYVRTGLALNAGGLAVVTVLETFPLVGRDLLGALLILLGTAVTIGSYVRWVANEEAMRTDAAIPPSRIPLALMLATTLVSLFLVAMLLVSR